MSIYQIAHDQAILSSAIYSDSQTVKAALLNLLKVTAADELENHRVYLDADDSLKILLRNVFWLQPGFASYGLTTPDQNQGYGAFLSQLTDEIYQFIELPKNCRLRAMESPATKVDGEIVEANCVKFRHKNETWCSEWISRSICGFRGGNCAFGRDQLHAQAPLQDLRAIRFPSILVSGRMWLFCAPQNESHGYRIHGQIRNPTT